jgi:hypothetical protein
VSSEFPQEAFQKLVANVHGPVFFDKLARDYGIVAQTVEDQQAFLELASNIQAKKAAEEVKAAAANRGFVHEVLSGVRASLVQDGILAPASPVNAAREQQIKAAAAQAAAHPELLEAGAIYAAYLASQGN